MTPGAPRPFFSVAVYAWMAALLPVLLVVFVVLLPWTLLFDRDRRAVARIGSFLVRSSLRVPRRWRPAMAAVSRLDLSRPAVIVVNHRSIADIAIAVSFPGGARLCAKPWVGQIPFMRLAMAASGHVLFDAADLGQVRDTLERLEGLLRRGTSVVFVPEGTRRTEPGLGEFEEGAFHVAVRTGVEVLPVIFTETDALVPRGRLMFHAVEPGVRSLPRVAPGEDRAALARAVREAMAAAFTASRG